MKKNYREIAFSPKFFRTSLRSLGYTYLSSLSELIDGPVDKKASLINISKLDQEDGLFTLVISDNGLGMPYDKIEEMISTLGYEGDYDSTDISTFGGGLKLAILNLSNFGETKIESVHKGKKSIMYFNVDDFKVTKPEIIDSEDPSGTIITIPNCSSSHRQTAPILKFLGLTYYPAFRKNREFRIIYDNREIEFIDPFYRFLKPEDFNNYIKVNPEKCEMFGTKVSITGYSLDLNMPDHLKLKMDINNNSKFSKVHSGIYLKVGSRYSQIGESNFISENYQTRLNNLRIEVEVEKDIIREFGVGMNKSLWRPDFNSSDFHHFNNIIKSIVTSHTKIRKESEPKNNLSDSEKAELDWVKKEVNAKIKNTIGNILKKPGINIPREKPDLNGNHDKEIPEEKRNRRSGYKQDRSILDITFSPDRKSVV